MIKNSTTSQERKEKGQAFQSRVMRMIKNAFFKKFPNLADDDISSCPSCCHGEDISLSKVFRSIFPVSIECKYRTTDYKLVNKNYSQAVEQSQKLGIPNIKPVLAIKRAGQDALMVMSIKDYLDLFTERAVLEEQVKNNMKEKLVEHIWIRYNSS